jgi:tetratricopeptide (TPR) repeat protein
MRWALPALVLLAACTASADRERSGDRAYGEGRYGAALADYRESLARHSTARVWAKAAAAAARSSARQEAVDAYLHLASEDPSRADEAADGLELVARAAERAGSEEALHAAVLGLRQIAPGRPIGRYAMVLLQNPVLAEADAVELLPYALGAAQDAGTFDSLLVEYGAALRKQDACDRATLAFGAALERAGKPETRARAAAGIGECGLRLGLAALDANDPDVAERWLVQAVRADSSSGLGRRALLALGRARVARADTLGALLTYQAAVAAGEVSDSISQAAAAQLRALEAALNVGDTARTGEP